MNNMTAEQVDQVRARVLTHIDQGEKPQALTILQDRGLDGCAAALTPAKTLVRHDFNCSVHGERVLLPCTLGTCKFFVSHEAANNCLLAYCHQQGTADLTCDEISYLYGQPIQQVRAQLDNVMADLRMASIDGDSEQDPDLARQFSFVDTDEVCCVCGTTTDADKIPVVATPLAYCSFECAEAQPPETVALEYRYGRPISLLVRWAIHRFRNLPLLERTLGLPRQMLASLCRQHTGRDLAGFFPKTKTAIESNHHLSGRSSDRGLPDGLLRVQQQLATQGGSIFKIDDLRSQLAGLL